MVRSCQQIAIVLMLGWTSAAQAAFIEMDFTSVGVSFGTSTFSVDQNAWSHSAVISAPGSTTPTASGSDANGHSIGFPLTYEQPGDYFYSLEGNVTTALVRSCSTGLFGHVTCHDVVRSLDPPGRAYQLSGELVVVPEFLANIDRLFAGEVGDELFWKPFSAPLYGISRTGVKSKEFSFIANGTMANGGIPFDTPGFYLIDWSGSTLDSFVTTDPHSCGPLGFETCYSDVFRPVNAPIETPYTYGVYVRDSNVAVVPLPAGVWLFITGLVGLVGFSKRKEA